MTVLITGFQAFNKEKINPASEAVLKLEDEINGRKIIKSILPTEFGESLKKLDQLIDKYKPDLVINVGQAGGAYGIRLERVGINIDDAVIQDNKGNQPIDEKIYEDGENAYFTKLPIKRIKEELILNNIPASISNSAGTYVCNHVMYGLLYLIENKYPNLRGGFIHVPYIPAQVMDKKDTPYMELNRIVEGLEIAIKVSLDYKEDIKLIGGETH